MALGLLSRRRVHQLAQQHLASLQRPGLGLSWAAGSRLRPSVPAQSALAAAEASDFHWHLAASDRVRWDSSAGAWWVGCLMPLLHVQMQGKYLARLASAACISTGDGQ